jgi:hypothetical protein
MNHTPHDGPWLLPDAHVDTYMVVRHHQLRVSSMSSPKYASVLSLCSLEFIDSRLCPSVKGKEALSDASFFFQHHVGVSVAWIIASADVRRWRILMVSSC